MMFEKYLMSCSSFFFAMKYFVPCLSLLMVKNLFDYFVLGSNLEIGKTHAFNSVQKASETFVESNSLFYFDI